MSTTSVAPPITGHAPARPWGEALLERFRTWSYYRTVDVASRRDLRLDLLRGFCIFAMVVDHFGGDSWLYAITGGNRFYVSAAEGFIFISGFVMGQAYRNKRDRSGLTAAMTDALRRARTLYIATVALTLIFSVLYLYTDIALWTGRDCLKANDDCCNNAENAWHDSAHAGLALPTGTAIGIHNCHNAFIVMVG